MSAPSSLQPQRQQQDLEALVRIGGGLFRRRTWLPLPIALALVAIRSEPLTPSALAWCGAALVASGEALRLSAVRHIGVVSRTRSDRLGPLVSTGPFAHLRNPLYLGNIAMWAGFTVSASLTWLVPPVVLLLAFEYHAIVRWEEQLLESRLGNAYLAYAARVPRWIPRLRPERLDAAQGEGSKFTWGETLFSERGTLVAIAVGYLLLWCKSQV